MLLPEQKRNSYSHEGPNIRSLLRLLTCTAVVSIMLFATADSMAGKKKHCRPVQVNRCPPVSCLVADDQVCPLYESTNWGNGVSSYYAMFNVNVDCSSMNPQPDASCPVNLNAASGIPPTDGLRDEDCIDASNLLRNPTPRSGRGRNTVQAGTSARTKINRIPNDQHLYDHHVDQKKYTAAQILRPMGSPRGELVRFQGLNATV